MVTVWWLTVAALGGAGAAALLTFLRMRRTAAARVAELAQLEHLVERRAEQVTALSPAHAHAVPGAWAWGPALTHTVFAPSAPAGARPGWTACPPSPGPAPLS